MRSIHTLQGTIWEEEFTDNNKKCYYMLTQVGGGKFLFIIIAADSDTGNRLEDKIITNVEEIAIYYPDLKITNKKINLV